jgi:hypothetical protein
MIDAVSVAAAAFVLARAFPERPWWPWYARVTGLVVLAGFFVSVILAAQEKNGGLTDAPVGLCQRVAIVAGWAFVSVTAYLLLKRERSGVHARFVSASTSP